MDDNVASSRLVAVTLDEGSIGRAAPEVEHERAVVLYDLMEENRFALPGRPGPYRLVLSLADKRLIFDVRSETQEQLAAHALSLTPFRTVVKDYFLICDSYHQAIRAGAPSRIEAIDMARRGLHDEGARTLIERLEGKIDIDFPTARRLFTLLSVLHWRG